MGGGGEDSFVQPLGYLLGLTAIVALLLSYAKQSTIVAFIVVGASINGLVGNENFDATILGHFSEVGILVLLFMAGLEVELHAFLKSWVTVLKVGVGQIFFLTALSIPLSLLVLPAIGSKSDFTAQLYFALCLTFSSTILVLGYLKHAKAMETVYGQLCLGTLVLQDVTSVLGIAVLGGLGGVGTCAAASSATCNTATSWQQCSTLNGCAYRNSTGTDGSRRLLLSSSSSSFSSCSFVVDGCYDMCAMLDLTSVDNGDAGLSLCGAAFGGTACSFAEAAGGGIGMKIFLLFVKLIIVCLVLALLNRYVLNKLFEKFAQSLELLYLGSLGYAFGLAALATSFDFNGEGGFSPEITAFLAGVSIAQLPYKMAIESKMEPIKSLGVAMFFLSLGLQLNFDAETLNAVPTALGLALFNLLLTLPLFMFLGYTAKLKSHDIWMLGLLMNQISEFSLILCTLSVRAGVLSPIVLTTMTVAAIVSIVVSSTGHIFIDQLYEQARRGFCSSCFACIDDRARGGPICGTLCDKKKSSAIAESTIHLEMKSNDQNSRLRAASLMKLPNGLEDTEWAFEDQLQERTTENLRIDLQKVDQELEEMREQMSSTAEDKKIHHAPSLYGDAQMKNGGIDHKMSTSHAIDIVHGLIEGYVIVERQLLFCTLRGGRMLFWHDSHDIGIIPPISVWDVSGMKILKVRTHEVSHNNTNTNNSNNKRKERRQSKMTIGQRRSLVMKTETKKHSTVLSTLDEDLNELVDEYVSDGDDDDSDDEDGLCVWDWTLVLAHLHRTKDMAEDVDDPMKLSIHGVKDHSDHDRQDWEDALSVVSATLNPIALRRAHILEELSIRRKQQLKASQASVNVLRRSSGDIENASNSSSTSTSKDADSNNGRTMSVEHRRAGHDHRDQIICLGYNEMFPAVLALADGTDKQVVLVEYDPVKIRAVTSRYNSERRNKDATQKKSTTKLTAHVRAESTSSGNKSNDTKVSQQLRGVSSVYADIHDPECWEELEMAEAFMIICTMKGARHAEKALVKWLKKHGSESIFIGFSDSNLEAIHLYDAGAHYVLQTDALAMLSTKQIFMETVVNYGSCSQLVSSGKAHANRLNKLQQEDEMKFRYET